MPPRNQKAALAAYRPLPFPSPFGTAYVLDPLPPALDPDDPEAASNKHQRRNSLGGWSADTLCTWEEFAVDDKLVDGVTVSSPRAKQGWVERFIPKVDRALTSRLSGDQIKVYTDAYSKEGYGTPQDPFVVRYLDGGEPSPRNERGVAKERKSSDASCPPSPTLSYRQAEPAHLVYE